MAAGGDAMKTRTMPYMGMLGVTLFAAASFAFGGGNPTLGREPAYSPATVTDFSATVTEVNEVPLGNPLAGLHVLAKTKGKTVDIYVAPADFAAKYGVALHKGQEIRVVGSEVKLGDADVVLAREITTYKRDVRGQICEDTTFYLRNDEGPFWD
jgi:hypothetical protein